MRKKYLFLGLILNLLVSCSSFDTVGYNNCYNKVKEAKINENFTTINNLPFEVSGTISTVKDAEYFSVIFSMKSFKHSISTAKVLVLDDRILGIDGIVEGVPNVGFKSNQQAITFGTNSKTEVVELNMSMLSYKLDYTIYVGVFGKKPNDENYEAFFNFSSFERVEK